MNAQERLQCKISWDKTRTILCTIFKVGTAGVTL